MPQSRTRTSRAADRAKYRKPKRRRSGSTAWTVAIVVVVLVFGAFVALQVSSNRDSSAGASSGHPWYATDQHAGDHWHTYLGVNICGEWLPAQAQFENPVGTPAGTQNAGIHTHGDSLIHTHPFVPSEAGANATLAKFAGYAGWSVSSDSIDAWTGPASKPDQKSWSNGDTCTFGEHKGQKGELVWAIDGEVKTGNPSDYRLRDGQTIAIGFLPKGTALPFPPNACSAFATITDQNTQAIVSPGSPCATSATSTTAPADTTTTTQPPSP
jgi:hypothetical protein